MLLQQHRNHATSQAIGNVRCSSPHRDSESADADRGLERSETRFWPDARTICKKVLSHTLRSRPERISFEMCPIDFCFSQIFISAHLSYKVAVLGRPAR